MMGKSRKWMHKKTKLLSASKASKAKGMLCSLTNQAVMTLPLSQDDLVQALSPFCSSFSTFINTKQKDPLQFFHGKDPFSESEICIGTTLVVLPYSL